MRLLAVYSLVMLMVACAWAMPMPYTSCRSCACGRPEYDSPTTGYTQTLNGTSSNPGDDSGLALSTLPSSTSTLAAETRSAATTPTPSSKSTDSASGGDNAGTVSPNAVAAGYCPVQLPKVSTGASLFKGDGITNHPYGNPQSSTIRDRLQEDYDGKRTIVLCVPPTCLPSCPHLWRQGQKGDKIIARNMDEFNCLVNYDCGGKDKVTEMSNDEHACPADDWGHIWLFRPGDRQDHEDDMNMYYQNPECDPTVYPDQSDPCGWTSKGYDPSKDPAFPPMPDQGPNTCDTSWFYPGWMNSQSWHGITGKNAPQGTAPP